ncbi:unnamed protein product, partial [Polarella glacialis]
DDFYCTIDHTGEHHIHRYEDDEPCFVEQLCMVDGAGIKGSEPCRRAMLKLRYRRNPVVGDKFSSRHGQKGVMSILWPAEDMPFTDSGITPDILFNPHGFPSRMTIGMLIESIAGKTAACEGRKTADGTTFREYSDMYNSGADNEADPFRMADGLEPQKGQAVGGPKAAEYFGNTLLKHGYEKLGTDRMYSGIHGCEIETDIFVGVVYYQRLRHLVMDKAQVRSRGRVDRLTNQPVKGRKKHGGIRFGEMERDSLLAHGASFLLRVRSFRGNFGFLQTDGFPGDIFVGLKGNPHLVSLSEGDVVEFEFHTEKGGKAEAANVRVAGGATGSFSSHSSRAAPSSAPPKGGAQRLVQGSIHQGWIRSFTGQWGFVNSDDFTGDLFVGARTNPMLGIVAQGDRVQFEIGSTTDGKSEAVNVVLLEAVDGATASRPSSRPGLVPSAAKLVPEGRAQVGHLVGIRLTGTIKSFKDQWGFINCAEFVGDLFMHLRSNPDLGVVFPGDAVQFEVAEDKQGGYNAVNTTVMKEDPQTLVGQRLSGWVKSFKEKWGLINSQRFDGDIFVGLGSNSHIKGPLTVGECVEFEIALDEKAKQGIQAVHVKPTGVMAATTASAQAASAPAGPIVRSCPPAPDAQQRLGARPPKPEALIGYWSRGTVRSFREPFGFVVSNDFEGDLFLHLGSNPGLSVSAGGNVEFDITQGPNGKVHATAVQVQAVELEQLIGQTVSGTVRSFSGVWGFVASPKYIGDVFVGMKSNPHLLVTLKQGDQIDFTVSRSSAKSGNKGYEASGVRVVGGNVPDQAAAMQIALAAMAQAQQQQQMQQMQQMQMQQMQPGDKFQKGGMQHMQHAPIARGGCGGARAGGARSRSPPLMAGRRSADPSTMVGSRLQGAIRSFKGEWGFVTSNAFQGDLFLGAKSNPHLAAGQLNTGDKVMFRVGQSPSGKPEALDVAKC